MRVVPLGLAALLWTGAALAQTTLAQTTLAQTTLAQTNTPHTDPGRSGITDVPVGAQAAPGATRGAVTGLGDADRGGRTGATVPGTTAQGTPQGPSAITNAPVGAGSSGTAQQGTTRP